MPMPRRGDVFRGKINDLCNFDVTGWRRRDISFYKEDLSRKEKFEYPTHSDCIEVIDTRRDHYKLNFSKPESSEAVCLGTPGKLKPWYVKMGYEKESVGSHGFVYFEYTGEGNKFLIFTEDEYRKRT